MPSHLAIGVALSLDDVVQEIGKGWRRFHEDFLVEISMEVSRSDVELSNLHGIAARATINRTELRRATEANVSE